MLARGCLDAPEAVWTRQLPTQTLPRRPQEAARALRHCPDAHKRLHGRCANCPDAHKRLHRRCRGCLEEISGFLNDQKAPKIASETLQRAPGTTFRSSGRSWRALNNEKPQKHRGFSSFSSLEHKPVLATEREARLNLEALL